MTAINLRRCHTGTHLLLTHSFTLPNKVRFLLSGTNLEANVAVSLTPSTPLCSLSLVIAEPSFILGASQITCRVRPTCNTWCQNQGDPNYTVVQDLDSQLCLILFAHPSLPLVQQLLMHPVILLHGVNIITPPAHAVEHIRSCLPLEFLLHLRHDIARKTS